MFYTDFTLSEYFARIVKPSKVPNFLKTLVVIRVQAPLTFLPYYGSMDPDFFQPKKEKLV